MLHVVVVGGGPAGLVAAAAVAGAGIRTTVIERAPTRVRPCLGVVTSPLLEAFNVPELLLSQRVAEVCLTSPTQRTAFLPLSSGDSFAGTMRQDLLLALLKRRAEEAGATFMQGTFLRFRHAGGDYPQLEVRLPDGTREQILADVVIGADGACSRVARGIGLPPLELRVAYQERFTRVADGKSSAGLQLHFGRKISADTYGWCVPQDDQLVVGVSTTARYGRRVWSMLAELKKRVSGSLEGMKSLGTEAFCYPLAARPQLAHDRMLLVGDAAGLVTAGVHDGLFYAMASGRMAAETIIQHRNVPVPERLAEYNTRWQAAYAELFAQRERLEQTFFGTDRAREALVDMAWNRDVRRLAVESYMSKTRFTPSLALGVRLRARQLTQLVKYRVSSPRRNEAEQAARALPVAENYLDFALRTEVPADLAPLDPTLRELEVPRAEPLEARLEPDALPHQVEI